MAAKRKPEKKKTEKKGALRKHTARKKLSCSPQFSSAPDMPDPNFPVVGIGASAGGLEAIEGFLRHVKSGCNMAFVIIQHRAMESKSIMRSLLEKYTDLSVIEIENNMKVQQNCIYLTPPHKEVSITEGRLFCDEFSSTCEASLPIDYFFRSLANDRGEHSICIIFSGTGTDGTLGLKEIKAAGGMTMAQDEKQAKYPSMPRNAIDTGVVDFILPVEKMPAELLKYVKHPYLASSPKHLAPDEKFENILQQIFRLIRSATGHDFSNYKRNTICRRIERRMAVHQISNIKSYIKFLHENTTEVKFLFKDMIITVTNFFRDPQAFKALKEKAIKEIILNKPLSSTIRIWIPGCATGEEAYSTAILFDETMEELEKRHPIQIFATDLDSETIGAARYGIYPESISADVSEHRLEKYFIKSENNYKIKTHIREMLVFAAQDLIKDPPFSKLDLVCCRNVLIYVNSELQRKIFPLFHYVLNPKGYLFLGTSETIGQFSDLFLPIDNHWKIFRHKPQKIESYEHPTIPLAVESHGRFTMEGQPPKAKSDISFLMEKMVLQDYSLPCVLVNEQFNILYFNGDTSPFLSQPSGQPTLNILKMARQELYSALSILLHKSQRSNKISTNKNMWIHSNGASASLDLIVRPVQKPEISEKYLMVIFDMKTKTEAGPSLVNHQSEAATEQFDPRVSSIEQELSSTKEYLQTTIEELETSNEELKSSNEELQSTNEELQSTNEELETSREELESTNEELRTVNAERQAKIDELARANDDLNNLLASTNIATVFLDTELRITRYTPEATHLFKFVSADVGRPLDNIVCKLEYDHLEADIRNVLDKLSSIAREIRTNDGTWVRIRIAPYRTANNVIDGVVITSFDINREKDAQHFAESIVETVRHPLLVLNKDLIVISVNTAFYQYFNVKPKETEGKYIYDLGNGQWDIPSLRNCLEDILSENTSFENFHVEHEFPVLGRRKMILNGRRILQNGKQTERILLAIEDVTQAQ